MKVGEEEFSEPTDVEKTIIKPTSTSPTTTTPQASQPREIKEPRKQLLPRTPVPKIQLRQATINQDVDDTVISPAPGPAPHSSHSTQSLATLGRSRRDSAASQRSRSNSKASSTSGHWLRDQLHDARIECPQRAHCFFVPRSVQEDLINVTSVSQDIRSHNPDIRESEADEYAKKACESARQLYATLAYIKKGADICLLLKEGIADEDLPFVRKPNARSKFALYRKDGQPIKTSEKWKEKYLEKFDRSQWWMMAPIFHFGKKLYDLDDNMFLPFVRFETNKDELALKQGGYSEVYPVRIHPAHHTFWPQVERVEDEPLIAVKKLFSPDETEFKKEETILRAVGLKNHPHLIKLLATYRHEGKYHLMFPYANANLRKYWDDRPDPVFDRATVLWSIRQMTGIANGLLQIHNFRVTYPLSATAGAGSIRVAKGVSLKVRDGEEWYGRHGDIKPENVLWFEKDQQEHDPNGVLQIADFGLGRFHGRDSRSGLHPDTIQSSPTYEPPECQLRQPVSRAYDIWSLGCLYLEFVTWLLRGSQEIEGFSECRGREATGTGIDDDNFFTIVNDGYGSHAIVRDAVVTWKDELHSHERCSDLIHDLLELTMRDLLVADSKQRCPASWLFQQLNAILMKAEKDEAYMLKPNPHTAKPANERSSSTPALPTVSMTQGERKSVTYTNDTKNPLTKAAVQQELPKDLLLRGPGTPNYNQQIVAHRTWPVK
ncbi:kinase-like domain-containing protein [Cadophora sp. MPI-SDFR-AT-0126]|nr:kinase-like domain-containing protein [Leotiomycetes sp. MPI-SDFR-AT-0126]